MTTPLLQARPEAPPERRPTWPRWRPAMRLAVRDVRHHRGRAALVVALVALPVALVVGVYLYGTSNAAGSARLPVIALGSQAAGSVEPVSGLPVVEGWTHTLPEQWRLVPWPVVGAPIGPDGAWATGTAGDFTDPVLAGLLDVAEGRAPVAPGEVLVTPALADALALTVGSTWRARVESWDLAEQPWTGEHRVVGIGEIAGLIDSAGFVLGAQVSGGGATRYLIDAASPITGDQVAAASQSRLQVVGRDLPAPGPDTSLTLTSGLVLGLTLAFLQIVMLAGAAFAVSVRRRQRELALLSAAGAEPGDLTRAMLASGALLGCIGAAVGVVVPWLVVVACRPLLEHVGHSPLAVLPPVERAILLVPIVGVLACLAASALPAVMASRIPLASTLRARDGVAVGEAGSPDRIGRATARAALAGVALVGLGIAGLLTGASGSGDPTSPVGWLGASLAGAVLLCELGVLLLAPLLLALIAARLTRAPLAVRLASRDASRNRVRTSFAVAAVAVAVGLVSGYLTWQGSVRSAVDAAGIAAAAPGTILLVAPPDASPVPALGAQQLAAVGRDLPGADLALIGFGPSYGPGGGASLALVSPCDAVVDLGAPPAAIAVMDPVVRGGLASALPAPSACRAPSPAGDPLAYGSVLRGAGDLRPGVVVVDADAAALLLGEDDPAVRAQLESGGAVALSPDPVVAGEVLLQVDPEPTAPRDDAGDRPAVQVAQLPALVHESQYRPAAVLVSPSALVGAGLPVPRNAILARPAPGTMSEALTGAVTLGGLEVRVLSDGASPLGRGVWVPGLVALLFAVLASLLVTGLALGEAGPELAVMAAVGASPGLRRRFAMAAAALVAGLGSVLGALAGIAPAWAALRALQTVVDVRQCLWVPDRGSGEAWLDAQGAVYCDVALPVALDVPWGWLGVVVAGVPLVCAMVFLVATRSRTAPARR